jgi:hypothetical protein
MMVARLKVFVTSDGLTDYVVAVSSRAKALAAWGVRQDLFKEGVARETDDPVLIKAATASPGDVLRRPAGSREALSKLKVPKKAKAPAKPSKAALRKVERLERRLASLEAAHAKAAQDFETMRAGLERKIELEARNFEAQREGLLAELDKMKVAITG